MTDSNTISMNNGRNRQKLFVHLLLYRQNRDQHGSIRIPLVARAELYRNSIRLCRRSFVRISKRVLAVLGHKTIVETLLFQPSAASVPRLSRGVDFSTASKYSRRPS